MSRVKRNKLGGDADGQVFQTGAMINLKVRCWGASSVLNEDFFGDQMPAEIVRAVYDLLPNKTFLEQLHGMRNEAKRYLYRKSMPFPIDGFVFILKVDIPEVERNLQARKEEFLDKVEQFLEVYESEVRKFATDYSQLYNPDKYPTVAEMRTRFKFQWVYRHFDVQGTMDVLPPEVFQSQMREARDEVREMVDMAVRAIGKQFIDKITSLQSQCSNGKINTATVDSLHDFMSNFEGKWDGYIGHQKLREMVAECKEYIGGVGADDLRYGEDLRGMIADKMQGIMNDFQETADARLHRRIDY
jgi:hypothetical protein